jgi:hypothetical protein
LIERSKSKFIGLGGIWARVITGKKRPQLRVPGTPALVDIICKQAELADMKIKILEYQLS